MEEPNSPCQDQTPQLIEAWLRENVTVGSQVVIRTIEDGLLRYELARVVRVGVGRFDVGSLEQGAPAKSSTGFYYSGRSTKYHRRPIRLVIPTTAVLEACKRCKENGRLLANEAGAGL